MTKLCLMDLIAFRRFIGRFTGINEEGCEGYWFLTVALRMDYRACHHRPLHSVLTASGICSVGSRYRRNWIDTRYVRIFLRAKESKVTSENLVLCLVFLLLSPLAIAGLALINQGLGRSRSAAHAMLGTLCTLAIACLLYTSPSPRD